MTARQQASGRPLLAGRRYRCATLVVFLGLAIAVQASTAFDLRRPAWDDSSEQQEYEEDPYSYPQMRPQQQPQPQPHAHHRGHGSRDGPRQGVQNKPPLMQQARHAAAAAASAVTALAKAIADSNVLDEATGTDPSLQQQQQQEGEEGQVAVASLDASVTISSVDASLVTETAPSTPGMLLQAPTILMGGREPDDSVTTRTPSGATIGPAGVAGISVASAPPPAPPKAATAAAATAAEAPAELSEGEDDPSRARPSGGATLQASVGDSTSGGMDAAEADYYSRAEREAWQQRAQEQYEREQRERERVVSVQGVDKSHYGNLAPKQHHHHSKHAKHKARRADKSARKHAHKAHRAADVPGAAAAAAAAARAEAYRHITDEDRRRMRSGSWEQQQQQPQEASQQAKQAGSSVGIAAVGATTAAAAAAAAAAGPKPSPAGTASPMPVRGGGDKLGSGFVGIAAVGAAAVTDSACSTALMQQQCDPKQPPPESSSTGTTAYWTQWRARCCKKYVPAEPTDAETDEASDETYTEAEVTEGEDGDKDGDENEGKEDSSSGGSKEDKQLREEEQKHNPPNPISKARKDLNRAGEVDPKGPKPELQLGTCTDSIRVPVPRFHTTRGPGIGKADGKAAGASSSSSSPDLEVYTEMTIEQVQVPARLSPDVIRRVKSYVMSQMHTFDPVMGTIGADPVRAAYVDLKWVNTSSGFVHPAGTVGPAELALLKVRLQGSKDSSIQKKALEVLLSGEGVPLKAYPPNNWAPPTDTPAKLGASPTKYDGPYPIESIQAGWYGADGGRTKCSERYPEGAPKGLCGHISLIELDGQMSYKQALAFWATGDEQYARNAFGIIDAWAKTNKELGLQYQNGPLESGWAVAAMAKALELLRDARGWQGTYDNFMAWTRAVTMPSLDYYVYNISAPAIIKGVPHVYNNWHTTVSEAWMSVALLTDDPPRFRKAVKLFNETLHSYLKWGKGDWAAGGRVPGECSETLRDVFHSEFGLGGLLQVAEMAWQQDIDLYATANYSMIAALELHARIINAGRNEALLPPGFKFVESLPKPKEGTLWKFDIRTQSWWAHNATNPEQRLSELRDGVKYLVGIMWLPTGWELGYNHYAGRLGIPMPETSRLLAAHPVEYFSFHWGLGTLTHAESAMSLWREGLKTYLVCEDPAKKALALQQALAQHKQQPQQQQQQKQGPPQQQGAAVAPTQAKPQSIALHQKQQQSQVPVRLQNVAPAQQQTQQKAQVQKSMGGTKPKKGSKALALQKLQQQLDTADQASGAVDDTSSFSGHKAAAELDATLLEGEEEQALIDVGMEQWEDEQEEEEQGDGDAATLTKDADKDDQEEADALEQQFYGAAEEDAEKTDADSSDEDGSSEEPSIAKMGLSMEQLRSLSRGELLSILRQKVKQFGLSRRQQLKIATEVYRDKRQHRKHALDVDEPAGSDWPTPMSLGATTDAVEDIEQDQEEVDQDGDKGDTDGALAYYNGRRGGRRRGERNSKRRDRFGRLGGLLRKSRQQKHIEHDELLDAKLQARAVRRWTHQSQKQVGHDQARADREARREARHNSRLAHRMHMARRHGGKSAADADYSSYRKADVSEALTALDKAPHAAAFSASKHYKPPRGGLQAKTKTLPKALAIPVAEPAGQLLPQVVGPLMQLQQQQQQQVQQQMIQQPAYVITQAQVQQQPQQQLAGYFVTQPAMVGVASLQGMQQQQVQSELMAQHMRMQQPQVVQQQPLQMPAQAPVLQQQPMQVPTLQHVTVQQQPMQVPPQPQIVQQPMQAMPVLTQPQLVQQPVAVLAPPMQQQQQVMPRLWSTPPPGQQQQQQPAAPQQQTQQPNVHQQQQQQQQAAAGAVAPTPTSQPQQEQQQQQQQQQQPPIAVNISKDPASSQVHLHVQV